MKRKLICEANNRNSPLSILGKDIIYKIQKYLNVKSFVYLGATSYYFRALCFNGLPNYEEACKISGMNRLLIYLEKRNLVDPCSQFLKRYNAIIAGGLPLMNLVGEDWLKTDIDIFVPHLETDSIEDVLKYVLSTFNFRWNINHDFAVEVSDVNDYNCIVISGDYISQSGLEVKIQFILTFESDIVDYVRQKFDLSFCKIYTPDLEHLYCDNVLLQMIKVGYIDSSYYMESTKGRLEKYKERGFEVLGFRPQ